MQTQKNIIKSKMAFKIKLLSVDDVTVSKTLVGLFPH